MKKRILFIGNTPPPYYGVSFANQVLLESQMMDEFDVILLDTTDRRDLDNMGRFDFSNTYLGVKQIIQIIYYMLVKKPDLVYTNLSQNKWAYLRDGLFILTAKIFRPKVQIVSHLNGGYLHNFLKHMSKSYNMFASLTFKAMSNVIVVGNNLKYIFEGRVKKINVVPNGVNDLKEVPFSFKMKHSDNEVHITFLSNFYQQKGILDYCSVAEYFLNQNSDLCFHFAGHIVDAEPETANYLNDFFEKYKTDKRVIHHGTVSGIAKEKLLLQTDIFLLPSYYDYEGHPLSLLEALSAGCVLLSCDQGAIKEILDEGKTGYILPQKNSVSFIKIIEKLIDDIQLLEKMQKNARQAYLDRFTSKTFSENVISVFNANLNHI